MGRVSRGIRLCYYWRDSKEPLFVTSQELEAMRENTIASNQQTIASLMQLQAQMVQIQVEQTARMNNIEAMFASILERLGSLEQLNRSAIGFATRDA